MLITLSKHDSHYDPLFTSTVITSLYKACCDGEDELVSSLLDQGENVNDGITYSICGSVETTRSPLTTACSNGHIKCIKMLLNVNDIDVNNGFKTGFNRYTVDLGINDPPLGFVLKGKLSQEEKKELLILFLNKGADLSMVFGGETLSAISERNSLMKVVL